MIKAYFFDFNGTLGESQGDNMVRKKINDAEHELLLVKKLDGVYIKNKNEVISILNNFDIIVYPDSEGVVSNLKYNYKLAIISNMYDISAQRFRRLFPNFINPFDVVTLSAEVGMKKPDNKIFIYTLNELNRITNSNISFKQVIMVGDKLHRDIEPARQLGMGTILIDRTKETLEDVI